MSSLPDVSLGGAPGPALDAPVPTEELDARPAAAAAAPQERPATEEAPLDLWDEEAETTKVLPAPAGEVVKLPDSDLDGDRINAAERALVLVRHWSKHTLQEVQQSTTRPGGIYAAQPESFAQYRAYVASRAWLPEGYDGRWLTWITVAYYNSLGWAGVAAGRGLAWLFSRMLRFNVAVMVTAVSVTLWRVFG
ncbi:hypothetical protein GCM10023085_44880 [Actinomadura viridis]|uniref:Uncharacterized protein n=1 Tax=Actinomadura viridis TaxID=58110 RepID=A0A931DMJ7_9ACTN|nr:hypothetical protein [Actinomadura viridis]MBG6089850.1 hypothetical protein [Actinomadura viridis]